MRSRWNVRVLGTAAMVAAASAFVAQGWSHDAPPVPAPAAPPAPSTPPAPVTATPSAPAPATPSAPADPAATPAAERAPANNRPVRIPNPGKARMISQSALASLPGQDFARGADGSSRALAMGFGAPMSGEDLVAQLVWRVPRHPTPAAMAQRLAPMLTAYRQRWQERFDASLAVLDRALQEALVRSFAPDMPYYKAVDTVQRELAAVDRALLEEVVAAADSQHSVEATVLQGDLMRWRYRVQALAEIEVLLPGLAEGLATDAEQSVIFAHAAAPAAPASPAAPAAPAAPAPPMASLAIAPLDARSELAAYSAERGRLLDVVRTKAREAHRARARLEMVAQSQARELRGQGAEIDDASVRAQVAQHAALPVQCALAQLYAMDSQWLLRAPERLHPWAVRQAAIGVSAGLPGSALIAQTESAIERALLHAEASAEHAAANAASLSAWRSADTALIVELLAAEQARCLRACELLLTDVVVQVQPDPEVASAATIQVNTRRIAALRALLSDLRAAGVASLPEAPSP